MQGIQSEIRESWERRRPEIGTSTGLLSYWYFEKPWRATEPLISWEFLWIVFTSIEVTLTARDSFRRLSRVVEPTCKWWMWPLLEFLWCGTIGCFCSQQQISVFVWYLSSCLCIRVENSNHNNVIPLLLVGAFYLFAEHDMTPTLVHSTSSSASFSWYATAQRLVQLHKSNGPISLFPDFSLDSFSILYNAYYVQRFGIFAYFPTAS